MVNWQSRPGPIRAPILPVLGIVSVFPRVWAMAERLQACVETKDQVGEAGVRYWADRQKGVRRGDLESDVLHGSGCL